VGVIIFFDMKAFYISFEMMRNNSIKGRYLPALFGFDGLMVSLLGSFIGGIIGICIGYKFAA
jgi:hypothetical protein